MCTSPEQSIPLLGQPAPLVRRAEVGTGLCGRVAGARQPGPLAVGLAAEGVLADPAGVAVGGADARPAVLDRLDRQRLAGERLRHLLGALVRLGAHGRGLGNTDPDLHYAGRMRGSRRA